MDVNEFLSLSYGDRQLITFVPDADVPEDTVQRPPQKEISSEDSARMASTFKGAAAGTALTAMASVLSAGSVPAILVLGGGVALLLRSIDSMFDKSRDACPKIHLLRKSWAKHFVLPPGQPRLRVVFAGHPAEPQNYIPIADFHRYCFEHKFSEILSILMHLGAQKIEVRHIRGWGQDFSERLSVGIARVGVSQDGAWSRSREGVLLYEAELEGGPPVALPTNLVWLPHESTWKQIVEGRTKFGLKTFSLNLQYTEDYGVNLGLKAEIQQSHLDLGGEFEKHESTTWEIRGTFRAASPN